MNIRDLRELQKHAEHMVNVRPEGKDRDVAQAFVTLSTQIIGNHEETEILIKGRQ